MPFWQEKAPQKAAWSLDAQDLIELKLDQRGFSPSKAMTRGLAGGKTRDVNAASAKWSAETSRFMQKPVRYALTAAGAVRRRSEAVMTKRKAYLLLQAALWTLLFALLAAGAMDIYREGAARQAAEGPAAPIYTREGVAARIKPLTPLLAVALCLTAAGLVWGIRDEGGDGPARRSEAAQRLRGRPSGAVTLLRAALLLAGAACVVAGILNGGLRDVLYKAINICTECIGLG